MLIWSNTIHLHNRITLFLPAPQPRSPPRTVPYTQYPLEYECYICVADSIMGYPPPDAVPMLAEHAWFTPDRHVFSMPPLYL